MAATKTAKPAILTRRLIRRIILTAPLSRFPRDSAGNGRRPIFVRSQTDRMRPMLRTPQRWLRWLTPGLYVKRWLLLLMVSILMIDLGIAYFLRGIYQETRLPGYFYDLTLQFLPHPIRALIFGGLGMALLLFSFYMLQRSVLGP